MKRTLFPLMLLLLAACQRDAVLPEATSAAKEVYLQYADRKDLIVALIGDYQGYNAVMLQAQDNEDWLRLCEEFGVRKHVAANALDTTRVSSLKKVYSHSRTFNFDSTLSVGETLTQVLDSLSRETSYAANNLNDGASDAVAQFLGNLAKNADSTCTRMRIDTSYSVTQRVHYDHGKLVDSTTSISEFMPTTGDKLLQTAHSYGNSGYLLHGDSDNLTLWLFFYSTMDEFAQIIDNITSKHTQQ